MQYGIRGYLSAIGSLLLLATMPYAVADNPVAVPSYADALKAYEAQQAKSANSKDAFSAEEMAIMQRAQTALAKRLPSPGLKVGDKAPDFSLPNVAGHPVQLSEELQNGPVILVFYRGAWCPFCNMHLHALQKAEAEFAKYHAQVIAVTPQSPDKSAEQVKKTDYPFEILSDVTSKVMKDYQLFYSVDAALLAVYKKHGLNLEQFNGKGRNVLPVPGTFVIDTQGIIRAMHADVDYKQRMEPAAIIAALQQIAANKSAGK